MTGELIHLTTKLRPETYEALRALADAQYNGKISVAARAVLEQALTRAPARSRGYEDGLRQGLHEARVAIQEAISNLWRG